MTSRLTPYQHPTNLVKGQVQQTWALPSKIIDAVNTVALGLVAQKQATSHGLPPFERAQRGSLVPSDREEASEDERGSLERTRGIQKP